MARSQSSPKLRVCFVKRYLTRTIWQSINKWRAIFFSFCVRQRLTLLSGLCGRFSQKYTLSLNLSQIGVNRGKLRKFLARTRRFLHPPSRLPLGSPEMGLTTGLRKKIEIISKIIRSTCSRSRLPQEKQGSPPAILLFLEAGIAPRNILYSFQQGSPLVRKIAADKGRPS